MMKKLLLLLSVGVFVTGANAQKVNQTSMILTAPVASENYQEHKKVSLEEMRKMTPWKYENRMAGKGTISGTRTYNYVDLLDVLNNVDGNFPYMWSTGDAIAFFTGGYDSSRYMGIGQVLHPWYGLYNDPAALDYSGKVGIQNYSAYTVDSVAIYGSYAQNINKMNGSVVDTLRVALIYGDGSQGSDIGLTRWFGGSISQDYGVDTIRVADVQYDFNQRVGEGANTRVIKNIPITQAVADDTLSNGLNRFSVHFGLNVPAGNLVAVTATVVTGDAAYSPLDTIFHGSQRSNNPIEFNMLRPWVFEQNAASFAKYEANNYNNGLGMLNITDTSSSVYGRYLNQFLWTKESSSEFPYIDFVVSCADCPAVSVANVANRFEGFSAYPNPASNDVTVKFGLEYADDVTVSIYNLVGQQIATQTIENTLYGKAKFDISNLANGMYIYTIETDEVRQSGRFSIAR